MVIITRQGVTFVSLGAAIIVKIFKEGYKGPAWNSDWKPNPLQLLITLTHSLTVEEGTPGESEAAAHVHVLEGEKLQPVMVASLPEIGSSETHPTTWSRSSFIVKAGNKELAQGLAYRTGVICTSSTAARATQHYQIDKGRSSLQHRSERTDGDECAYMSGTKPKYRFAQFCSLTTFASCTVRHAHHAW